MEFVGWSCEFFWDREVFRKCVKIEAEGGENR